MDDKISLVNWIDKFNLTCSNAFTISFFGMVFFTGFAISSLVVPPFQDKYGRKIVFVSSMVT